MTNCVSYGAEMHRLHLNQLRVSEFRWNSMLPLDAVTVSLTLRQKSMRKPQEIKIIPSQIFSHIFYEALKNEFYKLLADKTGEDSVEGECTICDTFHTLGSRWVDKAESYDVTKVGRL